MNLVFIYGPPATGKFTVAKELAKLTGYRVFPNHEVIGLLTTIMPYEDKSLSVIRTEVSRKLRIEIFTAATKGKINVVTTFGMSGPEYFGFFEDIKESVENAGGHVLFVQLLCSKEELLKINLREHLKKMFKERPGIFDKFPKVEHITIDNTNLTAEEVARKICSEYNLIS
jgi:tRNA uridine 5-carbamoylmethylation protein Kti12